MTYSEGRGQAYICPFNCSICQNRIGNLITHMQEDVKEIYDLLYLKQTGMMCMKCTEQYSLKERYYEDQEGLE